MLSNMNDVLALESNVRFTSLTNPLTLMEPVPVRALPDAYNVVVVSDPPLAK